MALRPRAALAAALVAAMTLTALRAVAPEAAGGPIEDALIDLRFRLRGPVAAPPVAAVVGIEDGDVDAIGLMAPMRAALAEAVGKLREAGAAAVALDLLLIGETAADDDLAAALTATPGALLATAAATDDGAASAPSPQAVEALRRSGFRIVAEAGNARRPPAARLLTPAPALARAATLSHVNLDRPDDRAARRAPLAVETGETGAVLPGMPLAAARIALGLAPDAMALWRGRGVRLGERFVRTDSAHRVLVNHYGGRGAIETVPLGAVLDGSADLSRFAGRAVLIGAAGESLGDLFATPFAPDAPGVEVLATLATNLIAGDVVEAGERLWPANAALAAAGAGLAWLAVWFAGPAWLAAAGAVGAMAAVWAALQGAFAAGFALDATAASGSALIAAALAWVERLSAERRGGRRLEAERRRLETFVSPLAAEALAQPGAGTVWRTAEATVAFVDVAGSVGLAETRTPAETAGFLARVQTAIAGTAAAHGGQVVERLGDGALVVFGLSGGLPGGGAREALRFAAALAGGDAEATLRVSVQHGPVALADVGGGQWRHLTVTGDTVNVAARLQETAKRSGFGVVAGRAALDAAGVDPTEAGWRPLPSEQVRGRQATVEAWGLAVSGDATRTGSEEAALRSC